MRIGMLQPAAGEEIAGRDQRGDDAGVGVALLALVVDDAGRAALGVRPEAGRVLGVEAVVVDGEGDGRVDAAGFEIAAHVRPDVEILAAMAGRGVDEAGAGVVSDVVAGEQRHGEAVAEGFERVIERSVRQIGRRNIRSTAAIAAFRHTRLGEDVGCQRIGQRPACRPASPSAGFRRLPVR